MQNRIIRVRKDAKMTQAEFGDALGVSRGVIAKFETGVTVPGKTVLLLISSRFNVNIEWLETGDGTPYGHQMIPSLVEALKPYPDIMRRLSVLLPRMTVDDWQALTRAVSEFVYSLQDNDENEAQP